MQLCCARRREWGRACWLLRRKREKGRRQRAWWAWLWRPDTGWRPGGGAWAGVGVGLRTQRALPRPPPRRRASARHGSRAWTSLKLDLFWRILIILEGEFVLAGGLQVVSEILVFFRLQPVEFALCLVHLPQDGFDKFALGVVDLECEFVDLEVLLADLDLPVVHLLNQVLQLGLLDAGDVEGRYPLVDVPLPLLRLGLGLVAQVLGRLLHDQFLEELLLLGREASQTFPLLLLLLLLLLCPAGLLFPLFPLLFS